MKHSSNRLNALFTQWYNNALNDSEKVELFHLLENANNPETLEPLLKEAYDSLKNESFFSEKQVEQMAFKITGRKKHNRKLIVLRSLAVAAVIAGIFFVGYWYLNDQKHSVIATTNDISAPQISKAKITLSNGSVIYLDSISKGSSTALDGAWVEKTGDEQIAYRLIDTNDSGNIQYNTLSNPKWSRVVNITLSDGTRVWLNAGSSLSYPVIFNGLERNVKIAGEVFFEVSPNKNKPFIVSSNDMNIEVLGTHFNVKAYTNEPATNITLVEGSIKIGAQFLKPGQQAMVKQGDIQVLENANISETLAWKNGIFLYSGSDLKPIMREISRWYDVNVIFENEINENFYIELNRHTSISTLLTMLEKTGTVQFEINHKTILVKSRVP